MSKRLTIPASLQADVVVECRRRCCVCYGLYRDELQKRGQIAHLDHDPKNNRRENLAWLCLEHHDEFDGKTSQSKGFTIQEVKRYRNELRARFADWQNDAAREQLLNFLASGITIDTMVDAAIRVAGQVLWCAETHAFDVLITDSVDYCDGDLYIPHLIVLDNYASWGWLTFSEEEREVEDGSSRVFITVKRLPVCDRIATRIRQRMVEQGKSVESLDRLQGFRRWHPQSDQTS